MIKPRKIRRDFDYVGAKFCSKHTMSLVYCVDSIFQDSFVVRLANAPKQEGGVINIKIKRFMDNINSKEWLIV